MKRTSATTQLTLLNGREAERSVYGPQIVVTDDMVNRYRSTIDLLHRKWRDERVRDFATSLSTHLKIAMMMDWEHTVKDIVAVLFQCEPQDDPPPNMGAIDLLTRRSGRDLSRSGSASLDYRPILSALPGRSVGNLLHRDFCSKSSGRCVAAIGGNTLNKKRLTREKREKGKMYGTHNYGKFF